MADDTNYIDMSKAKLLIGQGIATVEQMLQSSLVPGEQKAGLVLMRAQLLGCYAMVELRDHFLNSSAFRGRMDPA